MNRTFGGAPSGQGAISEWVSKRPAGSGRMEITECATPSKIEVTVDFVRPLAIRNINEITLEARANLTRVTWSMRGGRPCLMKIMGVFLNLERMMAKHFDSGLESLKSEAEG